MNIEVCFKNFTETFNQIDGKTPVDLKILADYVSVTSNPFSNFEQLSTYYANIFLS